MNRKIIFQAALLFVGATLCLASYGFTNSALWLRYGNVNPQNFSDFSNPSNSLNMNSSNDKKSGNPYYSRTDQTKLNVSDAEWKRVLPPDLYEVSRNKATERAFTGKYWDYTGKGTYYCAACGNRLFRSDAKFASSCGWPSFFEQINPESIVFHEDHSLWNEPYRSALRSLRRPPGTSF